MAIIVVMEAEAGIGIIDYELIADIHDVAQGVFRIARPNGRREHWRAGYYDAVHALRHSEIFDRSSSRYERLVTFDFSRDRGD
jgi:hypothetical protein